MMTSKAGSAVNAKSAERIGTAESPSNRSGRRPHVAAVRPTHGANSATTIWGSTIKADTGSEDECPSERASGSLTCGRIEAFASWKRRRQVIKAKRRTSLKRVRRLTLLGSVVWQSGAPQDRPKWILEPIIERSVHSKGIANAAANRNMSR